MARLIDVARAAGVSRSTASNVFNNPEMVRPRLRERVEAAARDLGYFGPDPKARSLRAGKVNAIAVVGPADLDVAESLRNPVFRLFLTGVAEACDEVDANLVIVPDRTDDKGIRNAIVDGFIFSRVEHLSEIGPARLRRLPFAVVDFDPGPNINSVLVDSRAGAYAAARHLIDQGHRRFGIISFLRRPGPSLWHPPGAARAPEAFGMPIDQEKYRGYMDALAEVGIDIADVPMVQAEPRDERAPAMLLDSAHDITAVLSMGVMQGMELLAEVRRRGLSVPADLSVVAYNDIPEAAHCDPPLTTVDAMGVEKGRVAGRIVFSGGAPRQEVIKPALIIRGSSGPIPNRER